MQEKEQTRLNKLCSRKENNAQRSYTLEPDEIQANEQYRRYDTDKPPSVEEEEEPEADLDLDDDEPEEIVDQPIQNMNRQKLNYLLISQTLALQIFARRTAESFLLKRLTPKDNSYIDLIDH